MHIMNSQREIEKLHRPMAPSFVSDYLSTVNTTDSDYNKNCLSWSSNSFRCNAPICAFSWNKQKPTSNQPIPRCVTIDNIYCHFHAKTLPQMSTSFEILSLYLCHSHSMTSSYCIYSFNSTIH